MDKKALAAATSLTIVTLIAGVGIYYGASTSADAVTIDAEMQTTDVVIRNESDQGRVEAIELTQRGTATWQGMPDATPGEYEIHVSLLVRPNESAEWEWVDKDVVATDGSGSGSVNYGPRTFDALRADALNSEMFSATEDGQTRTQTFQAKTRVRFIGGGARDTHNETYSVTVEVTNTQTADVTVTAEDELTGTVVMDLDRQTG